jgi:hypothetical protein
MQRTWMKVGAEHTATEKQRAEVLKAIEAMEWQRIPGPDEKALVVGMMPGENIKECIRELRLPKVSAIAISNEMAPYGLYGIESNFKNRRARLYVLDKGHVCTPLCSDFWPKEESRDEAARSA